MNLKNTYKPEDINEIIFSRNSSEFENLEFKTDTDFDYKKRADYCAAISNSGGGALLLGVDNGGRVVGTNLYQNAISKQSSQIRDATKISVKVEEVFHQNGRVVIFEIPPHPARTVVASNGKYHFPKRVGEDLQEMSLEEIEQIRNESYSDYTAEIVRKLTISDLDDFALDVFKKTWADKTGDKKYLNLSHQEALVAAELINNKGEITRACLILLGSEPALKKYLPCCEIIFEWRQTPNKISHDFRRDSLSGFRRGFFSFSDEILKCFLDRNSRFPLQQGFFQNDIWAFNEGVLREAILNAVTHRDYRDGGSIFIKASPDGVRIENPGGLIHGITKENILKKHQARNRLLSEVFQKLRLVERSGQGLDKIFRDCIIEGKGEPNFSDTDDYSFVINISATLKDIEFVKFFEEAINKKQISLSSDEIIELEKIRLKKSSIKISSQKFIDLGLVEKIGHGRGTKYILSHNFYQHKNNLLKHTKIVGLSREKNKSLIIAHIEKHGKVSSREIQEAFREWSTTDVNNIIQELRKGGKIKKVGTYKNAHWILNNS